MRIGIFTESKEIIQRLTLVLTAAGHECAQFDQRSAFIRDALGHGIDLAVLDWSVAGESGVDVLRELRRWFDEELPVMVIGVPSDEDSALALLRAGADDYQTGTPHIRVMAARIESFLQRRRLQRRNTEPRRFGRYQVMTDGATVMVNDEAIELTKKEYELARFLFENANRVLSRRLLLARVWGLHSDLYTRTVDAHMSRLRKKLALIPANGWRLSSIYGRGYQLERVTGAPTMTLPTTDVMAGMSRSGVRTSAS
ncbi:MAG: response regulator transcription factor [Gammaproteobacteria bacterium]|nr:response regulator transcription factor [Gammaproteobacteria bacterium]MCP5135462.1 response regulator transcription factor [Gammaproteobacteria bacterium]